MSAATTLRVFSNVLVFWLLSVFLCLAMFNNTTLFKVLWWAAWITGMMYGVSRMLVVWFMLFGLTGDDYAYYSDDATLSYFKKQVAWGNRMDNNVGQDEFFRMLDIQLEAANLVVGMMAGAFYEVGMTIWRPLAAQGYTNVPWKASEAKGGPAPAAAPEEPTPKDDEDGF